ncbi:MAG: hypothetical protein M1828_006578 [Chrysothrix sp. TS-e1954]|nr:MAG: hypothetical protein M1828_006578 [Chrysothrix sp. TS-e1954]
MVRTGIESTRELATTACVSLAESIASDCSDGPWTDKEFLLDPPLIKRQLLAKENDETSSERPHKTYSKSWEARRVSEIHPRPLWMAKGTNPVTDIKQGLLGDCGVVAAVASISSYKQKLQQICVYKNPAKAIYGFVFDARRYKDREEGTHMHKALGWGNTDLIYDRVGWEFVIVDDFLVTIAMSSPETSLSNKFELIFGRCAKECNFWFPLLEKAYAKSQEGYHMIDGEDPANALGRLTGGDSSILPLECVTPEKLWTELTIIHSDATPFYLWAARPSQSSTQALDMGLFTEHIYSILAAREYNGTRLIKLRNPWGRGRGLGRWSGTEMPVAAARALGYDGRVDDGVFWFQLEDFLECFSRVYRTWVPQQNWSWSMAIGDIALNTNSSFAQSWSGVFLFRLKVQRSSSIIIELLPYFADKLTDCIVNRTDNLITRDTSERMPRSYDFEGSSRYSLSPGTYLLRIEVDDPRKRYKCHYPSNEITAKHQRQLYEKVKREKYLYMVAKVHTRDPDFTIEFLG